MTGLPARCKLSIKPRWPRQGCIKLSILSPRGASGERTEERGNQSKRTSSPQPSPPSDGGEGEIQELDAALCPRSRMLPAERRSVSITKCSQSRKQSRLAVRPFPRKQAPRGFQTGSNASRLWFDPFAGLTPFRLVGIQLSSRIGRINRFELAGPSGHHPGETMPNPTTASGIPDNHRRGVVADFLGAKIQPGSRPSVTSADLTFYTFHVL